MIWSIPRPCTPWHISQSPYPVPSSLSSSSSNPSPYLGYSFKQQSGMDLTRTPSPWPALQFQPSPYLDYSFKQQSVVGSDVGMDLAQTPLSAFGETEDELVGLHVHLVLGSHVCDIGSPSENKEPPFMNQVQPPHPAHPLSLHVHLNPLPHSPYLVPPSLSSSPSGPFSPIL